MQNDMSPKDFLMELIFEGLTMDEIDNHIYQSKTWTQETRSYAVRNYKAIERMINRFSDIRAKRKRVV